MNIDPVEEVDLTEDTERIGTAVEDRWIEEGVEQVFGRDSWQRTCGGQYRVKSKDVKHAQMCSGRPK